MKVSHEVIQLKDYVSTLPDFPESTPHLPWEIVANIGTLLREMLTHLDPDYQVKKDIAIHRSATIENHVMLKGPIIIGPSCFIGAHAYLRGGVFLGGNVSIGPGCEIKSSIILERSVLAHFNFVGDSIIGERVNMEAGSVIANHYNERENKLIQALHYEQVLDTGVTKFGALVGDHSRIGANAVLSPGTMLRPSSIVRRLELVEQIPFNEE